MAPLRRPELCAIEGESLAAYVLQSGVGLSVRSLAARRFHAGGKVLLLGRMPSSRVFCACAPREAESSPDDKAGLRFVSLFDAARHELTGFRFPFSIGESVLSDTKKVLRAGKTVLWLLDRRGEAGEIRCLECDQPVVCGRCGAGVTLRGGRLVCPVCRWSAELPMTIGSSLPRHFFHAAAIALAPLGQRMSRFFSPAPLRRRAHSLAVSSSGVMTMAPPEQPVKVETTFWNRASSLGS